MVSPSAWPGVRTEFSPPRSATFADNGEAVLEHHLIQLLATDARRCGHVRANEDASGAYLLDAPQGGQSVHMRSRYYPPQKHRIALATAMA